MRTIVLIVVLLLLSLVTVNSAQAERRDLEEIELLSEDIEQKQNVQQLRNKQKAKRERKKKAGGVSGKKKRKEGKELVAIRKWAEGLGDSDYSVEGWKDAFHSSSASDFFNGYARKISDIFKDIGAKLNFALIGACDGLGDKTIKKLYLPNEHWRGLFVEPMSINIRDLISFMSKHNAAHRSLIIRAAATSFCENATIKVERPLYEEKNVSIPHWLRRQIGSVLPKNRDHARKEWIIEEVRCVTARDVLTDWAGSSASNAASAPTAKKPIRRPHILKIDVEGHDYEVLMGFLRPDTPPEELPLIIDFEAKSIAKKYPEAKARMEDLGYVVTPFGQDGFALLKADRIFDSISHGGNSLIEKDADSA